MGLGLAMDTNILNIKCASVNVKKKIKSFAGVKYSNCQEKTASSVVLIIAVKLKFTKFSRFSTCKNLYL